MSEFYYGGQAVVEGVMMRGRREAVVAVRKPDGEIVVNCDLLPGGARNETLFRVPFLRGVLALWETLVLGMRSMMYSANVQARAQLGSDIPKGMVRTMMTISAAAAVLVFFVMPLIAARAGFGASHALLGNLFEGLLRLVLFVGYLALIGRMSRVRRIFQYHGAEHKTIHAYEHRAELTPRSVQQFSTLHPRCGTAFLLWVVVLSIVVFGAIGHPPILLGILSRIVLIPVIAAASYEFLRLGARFYHVPVVHALVQPGLWLQRLTTREPDDDQVEVAIAALVPVLRTDGAVFSTQSPGAALLPADALT